MEFRLVQDWRMELRRLMELQLEPCFSKVYQDHHHAQRSNQQLLWTSRDTRCPRIVMLFSISESWMMRSEVRQWFVWLETNYEHIVCRQTSTEASVSFDHYFGDNIWNKWCIDLQFWRQDLVSASEVVMQQLLYVCTCTGTGIFELALRYIFNISRVVTNGQKGLKKPYW